MGSTIANTGRAVALNALAVAVGFAVMFYPSFRRSAFWGANSPDHACIGRRSPDHLARKPSRRCTEALPESTSLNFKGGHRFEISQLPRLEGPPSLSNTDYIPERGPCA